MNVSRETEERLRAYATLLLEENQHQNLIARATEDAIWDRHILDSVQLVDFAPEARSWIDIGTGPGLPGIVIAIVTQGPVTLVEPRALRVEFLRRTVSSLALDRVTIVHGKANAATGKFDAITARAVASTDQLFAMTLHLSHSGTRWILPKGRSAQSELEQARRSWQGQFRVEPSATDPDAGILVADRVRARGR